MRRSVCRLFILYSTKSWLYFEFLKVIFLISLASSFFSPGIILDEIWFRYVLLDTPDRRHVKVLYQYQNLNSYYFSRLVFQILSFFKIKRYWMGEAKNASSSKSIKIIWEDSDMQINDIFWKLVMWGFRI